MDDLGNRIIDCVRRNRTSTTEIADCLGKTGALPGVMPLNRGKHVVGRVFWAYACNESNWALHEKLRQVEPDTVVVVEHFNCAGRSSVGALISKFVLVHKEAGALVARAPVRDAPDLIRENWPIWCESVNPVGCFNRESDSHAPPNVVTERDTFYEQAIAVCDDCGVVIIPKAQQTDDFLDRVAAILEQEKIWFDCIDRRQWDTFDTVCRKRYRSTE